MFGERRKHQRFAIKRIARIQADIGAMTASRECTIIDISEHGARLLANSPDIPDQFYLVVIGDNATRHECRVVWRLGCELGVEFASLQSDQSRLNAVERIREDARQIFQAGNQTK